LSGGIKLSSISNEIFNNKNQHTPATIINIFNNYIRAKEEREIIIIQGTYKMCGRKDYNGYYYDELKDETNNQTISIKVPILIRAELQDMYTYNIERILK